MKTFLECIPCFMKQALQAGKISSDDPVLHKKILDAAAAEIPGILISECPPKMGRKIHELVKTMTNNPDPYKKLKEKYNKEALSLYPYIKERVENSKDPLLTSIRAAIAGNVIDFGAQLEFDLVKDLDEILHAEFAVFDYEKFKTQAAKHKKILYLGDNAGETVFDRVLIERLILDFGAEITYAVKEKPIINDATREDALFAGIDKYAKIISSGSDAPGTIPEYCSAGFLKIFETAPFIISKGQGNFEALSETDYPIFFLLKIKCGVLAGYTGLPLGSIMLKSLR